MTQTITKVTVTNLKDSGAGSLRDAVNQSNASGGYTSITFAPSLVGSIALKSSLLITAPITIDGGSKVTVNGGGFGTSTGPDFVVSGAATTAVINNLEIDGGFAQGANGTTGTAVQSDGGPGADAAGGILVKSGSLSLSNDYFIIDKALGGNGGNAYSTSKKDFFGNGGQGGSAAGAVYIEPGATVVMASDLTWDGNDVSATAGMGGISEHDGHGLGGMAYTLSNNSAIANAFTVACYAAGTRILTPSGEVEVETLAAGNLVVTASGAHRPIRWIGRRAFAGRFLASNPRVHPIRFRAGSLGGGLPRRDLLVSPDHAMFLDEHLVPARCLVNGVTILRESRVSHVNYIHVELDSHDVILAEGAASETFVDDDSRAMFHNSTEWDTANPGAQPVAAVYAAPRLESGDRLETLRRRLAARSAA